MSTPELAVRQLARLPSNCTCPNCGTWSRFGFSAVCIKFFTFVCDKCKSSHQAISHRCKSLTMSSWDHGEVLKLKVHGNDYARKVWLATAPPPGTGGRPREGDDIDVFKRFVVEVYERRRYYGEFSSSGGCDGGNPIAGAIKAAEDGSKDVTSTVQRQCLPLTAPDVAPVPLPPTKAADVVDLLDIGAFDSPTITPVMTSAPPAAPTTDLFFDPFDDQSASVAMIPNVVSPQSSFPVTTNDVMRSSNATNSTGKSQADSIMSFYAFGSSSKSAMAYNNNVLNSNNDPFSGVTEPPAMSSNAVGGMATINPSSIMMNGSASNLFHSNNNNSNMWINGSSNLSSCNTMTMNGASINNVMMTGGFNNMMHNNTTQNNFMTNNYSPSAVMMNPMTGSGGFHPQPYRQSSIMNSGIMGSSTLSNNPISNNFSMGSAVGARTVANSAPAKPKSDTKPDPFAGLMGLY